jgi:hypothetical protein
MRYIINKLPFILTVLISLILANAVEAESSDTLFNWTPIEVRRDLAPDFKGKEINRKLIEDPLHFLKIDGEDKSQKESVAVGEKKDASWNEFNLWYFKIYLSTITESQGRVHWSERYVKKENKLEMIKSLPSMFQTAPSRETLESMGKIIEPEIKLGITF